MAPGALPPNASLNDVLSDRARRATPARLGLDVMGGGLVAAAALWARPIAWGVVASAAGCLFFYGLWAMAERQLRPDSLSQAVRHELPWFMVRAAAGILGIGAFVAFILALLALALGTIIS